MMAKTKSLGAKVEPALSKDIDYLKEAFGFDSFADLLEASVELLKAIDNTVCAIERHPRDWSTADVREYLSVGLRVAQDPHISTLVMRRLRERFGQDGAERVRKLLNHQNGGDQL